MVSESNWRREHAQRPKSWLGLGKLFSSTNWVANPTDSTMKLGKNLCWKLGIHDRFKIFLWRLTTNVFPNRIRMLKFKKPFKASKKMRLASTCFLHCPIAKHYEKTVLKRGLKRATIGPVGLRLHFLNRGPRPGPIAAVKTRPQTDQD